MNSKAFFKVCGDSFPNQLPRMKINRKLYNEYRTDDFGFKDMMILILRGTVYTRYIFFKLNAKEEIAHVFSKRKTRTEYLTKPSTLSIGRN